eukprot:XP_001689686.1 predicted protein [Chlamydomonas reinhardtii]
MTAPLYVFHQRGAPAAFHHFEGRSEEAFCRTMCERGPTIESNHSRGAGSAGMVLAAPRPGAMAVISHADPDAGNSTSSSSSGGASDQQRPGAWVPAAFRTAGANAADYEDGIEDPMGPHEEGREAVTAPAEEEEEAARRQAEAREEEREQVVAALEAKVRALMRRCADLTDELIDARHTAHRRVEAAQEEAAAARRQAAFCDEEVRRLGRKLAALRAEQADAVDWAAQRMLDLQRKLEAERCAHEATRRQLLQLQQGQMAAALRRWSATGGATSAVSGAPATNGSSPLRHLHTQHPHAHGLSSHSHSHHLHAVALHEHVLTLTTGGGGGGGHVGHALAQANAQHPAGGDVASQPPAFLSSGACLQGATVAALAAVSPHQYKTRQVASGAAWGTADANTAAATAAAGAAHTSGAGAEGDGGAGGGCGDGDECAGLLGRGRGEDAGMPRRCSDGSVSVGSVCGIGSGPASPSSSAPHSATHSKSGSPAAWGVGWTTGIAASQAASAAAAVAAAAAGKAAERLAEVKLRREGGKAGANQRIHGM